MNLNAMPRKKRLLSIDEPLLEAIDTLCERTGVKSFSVYVEKVLAAHAINAAVIPPTYETPGETRGGNQYERSKKGKKKGKPIKSEAPNDAN